MKKVFTCILAALLLCTIVPPVYAMEISGDELTLSTPEHYAYMDLNTADAATKAAILEARNEIINNTSWVADGLYGYVTDAEGNVIEVVPQFSNIFPSDWEIPDCILTNSDAEFPEASPYTWQQAFEGSVTMSTSFTEFHTVSTGEFAGLVVETINTVAYNTDGGTYNIQYYNKTTGNVCGQKLNLDAGTSFSISAPEDATVSVRASTNGRRLGWYMTVYTDRVSVN